MQIQSSTPGNRSHGIAESKHRFTFHEPEGKKMEGKKMEKKTEFFASILLLEFSRFMAGEQVCKERGAFHEPRRGDAPAKP